MFEKTTNSEIELNKSGYETSTDKSSIETTISN